MLVGRGWGTVWWAFPADSPRIPLEAVGEQRLEHELCHSFKGLLMPSMCNTLAQWVSCPSLGLVHITTYYCNQLTELLL